MFFKEHDTRIERLKMEEQGAPKKHSAVWKITRPIADQIELVIPAGATLLKVADQHDSGGELTFWFLVPDIETPAPERVVKIGVVGTGHTFSPERWVNEDYFDTVVTFQGALVWHVFVEGER